MLSKTVSKYLQAFDDFDGCVMAFPLQNQPHFSDVHFALEEQDHRVNQQITDVFPMCHATATNDSHCRHIAGRSVMRSSSCSKPGARSG